MPFSRLSKAQFIHLASLVKEIFPTETSGTWYTPSHKSSPPNGKLYSKYNNYKTALDQVGITQRLKRTTEQPNNYNALANEIVIETEYLDPLETIKAIDFEDLKQFTDCWMLTLDERLKIIKSQGVKSYLETFPYLKSESGYEMVGKNCTL